jgi:hypothetical protein
MENRNTTREQLRGARKRPTLMVLGDRNTLILPLFLHVYHGKLKGILLTPGESPSAFDVSVSDFRKSDVRLVKD